MLTQPRVFLRPFQGAERSSSRATPSARRASRSARRGATSSRGSSRARASSPSSTGHSSRGPSTREQRDKIGRINTFGDSSHDFLNGLKCNSFTGWPIWSRTWVRLTWIWEFPHLAQLPSRFCQTPISPGRIRQTVE